MTRIPPDASTDVQQSFRAVWAAIDPVIGARNFDLQGRRIVNAGGAVNDGDYLTKADLKNATADALPGVVLRTKPAAAPASAASDHPIIIGTHAERVLTATVPLQEGTLFLETDRTALYRLTANLWLMVGSFSVFDFLANRPTDLTTNDTGFLYLAADQGVLYRWTGLVWVYMAGILRDVRSARPLPGNCDSGMIFEATDQGCQAWIKDYGSNDWSLLAGWGEPMAGTLSPSVSPAAADVGFLYRATDFDRVYRWTGSAWEDAPGQPRRGMMVFADGSLGTGWHVCDGSSVSISTATGGTTSKTLPNFNSGIFPRANSSAGGAGGASTHTHVVNPPNTTSSGPSTTTTSGASTSTTSGPTGSQTGVPDGTTTVDNDHDGSTVDVASSGHEHPFVHTHDFSHTHTRSETHDVDIAAFDSASASSLPPYQDAILMYRL